MDLEIDSLKIIHPFYSLQVLCVPGGWRPLYCTRSVSEGVTSQGSSPTPLSSVQFSHSVVSNSLRTHELQHARPPCPSPVPRVYPHPSIESLTPSNHLILCHPLLLLSSIFPSIMVFSNESALHIRWLKYWSFSFNISPSNEQPELISFRMDW